MKPRQHPHEDQLHYRRLERLYETCAAGHAQGSSIEVGAGVADVSFAAPIAAREANTRVCRSVLFGGLEAAALFAASSGERRALLRTVDFNIRFLRVGTPGPLFAHGIGAHRSDHLHYAQAELFDGEGRMIAFGSGTFFRTDMLLSACPGYLSPANASVP